MSEPLSQEELCKRYEGTLTTFVDSAEARLTALSDKLAYVAFSGSQIIEFESRISREDALNELLSTDNPAFSLDEPEQLVEVRNTEIANVAAMTVNSLHNQLRWRANRLPLNDDDDAEYEAVAVDFALENGTTHWHGVATSSTSDNWGLAISRAVFTPPVAHPRLPRKAAHAYEAVATSTNDDVLVARVYTVDGKPFGVQTGAGAIGEQAQSFISAFKDADNVRLLRAAFGRFKDEAELEDTISIIRDRYITNDSTVLEIEEIEFNLRQLRAHAQQNKEFVGITESDDAPEVTIVKQLRHLLR